MSLPQLTVLCDPAVELPHPVHHRTHVGPLRHVHVRQRSHSGHRVPRWEKTGQVKYRVTHIFESA